ncbi:MAG TPA: sensor domain-containing protein [Rhizomicrobium sp.]|nr:sensor domain-containing protein [Rhizomicrobium sp.]
MTEYNSVDQYLEALKRALAGAPAGLIADALADCEEHLRGALAAHPGRSEAEVFADMARSYGSPEEVAAEYRAMDLPPASPFNRQETTFFSPVAAHAPSRWTFFNVFSDPRTYGSLLYMLLALATGIFYFVWATVGVSMTLGLAVLIVGIPFFLVFVYSVRLLALVEGRIVEALLGVRMPRRLPAASSEPGLLGRIKDYMSDLRTWSSLFYMFLMLPLGITYFVIAVVGLSVSGGLLFASGYALVDSGHIRVDGGPAWLVSFAHSPFAAILCATIGIVAFFLVLHLARALGRLHGRIAEHLLVRL